MLKSKQLLLKETEVTPKRLLCSRIKVLRARRCPRFHPGSNHQLRRAALWETRTTETRASSDPRM